MPAVAIQILRFADEQQPGWVECLLIDSLEQEHHFIEKIPVVSAENLSSLSTYPLSGVIDCEIEDEWKDDHGQSFVRICTEQPWGVESTTGATRFVVFSNQMVRR